jgi:hypothetical protein
MPANSIFTYGVTRQYPAKFTWIIIIGGAIVITLFTLVGFAGDAYQLEPYYTDDYNGTVGSVVWWQRQAFSWTTDEELATTCSPALLTIGGDHTTTNQAFHYEIKSFHYVGNESNIPLNALYSNNPLTDCQVEEITIELVRNNQNRLPRNYWTWGDSYARSTVECRMDTGDGPMRVEFTSQLPSTLRRSEITDSSLALNDNAHPGSYLGAQILTSWYTQLSAAMGFSAPGDLLDGTASWGSAEVKLTKSDVMDYKSPDFFYIDTGFRDDGGGLNWLHPNNTIRNWQDQWLPKAAEEGYNASMPNISIVVDVFAKTYYSLLVSDFNSTEDVKLTNALSTADGLRYLQNVNNTDLAEVGALFSNKTKGTIGPILENDTNFTQPLSFAEHTTLFSRYLCSKPSKKNQFKIVFAIVLADIVFLGACWRVFGWVATWWLGRKVPNYDHCEGCVTATHDIPLAHAPGSVGGGSYSQLFGDTGDEQRGEHGPLSPPHIARVHSGV